MPIILPHPSIAAEGQLPIAEIKFVDGLTVLRPLAPDGLPAEKHTVPAIREPDRYIFESPALKRVSPDSSDIAGQCEKVAQPLLHAQTKRLAAQVETVVTGGPERPAHQHQGQQEEDSSLYRHA